MVNTGSNPVVTDTKVENAVVADGDGDEVSAITAEDTIAGVIFIVVAVVDNAEEVVMAEDVPDTLKFNAEVV